MKLRFANNLRNPMQPAPTRQKLSFQNQLQSSLVPSIARGSATATYTRASTAYVLGYTASAVIADGPVYILCASGEARFMGARRVSQGVWSTVDANGVALTTTNGASASCTDTGGPFGYLAEGARADVLGTTDAIRRTMTDVGWVNTTMTVGSATGVDGVASAGASLTAGGANSTSLFTTVLASAARTYSVWARRKTGTGTVQITDNNGTNWTTITLTSSYKQFQITRTQANPIVGFRIVTSGDAIEVDFNTIEAASFANPTPIPVNVSKAADVLTYVAAGNISITVGSAYAEFRTVGNNGGNNIIVGNNETDTRFIYVDSTPTLRIYDGTNVCSDGSAAFNAMHKGATSWGGTSLNAVIDGGSVTTATFDGSMGAITNLGIGSGVSGASQPFGTIRNVRIYNTALPSGTLQSLTT